MEVDHFNPTLTGSARHEYNNLFLATHHCNLSKRALWPGLKERKAGIYVINPCEESDYGVHIFEHPETHRLIGITPAGDYHITACDLNATHLIDERRERAIVHELLNCTPVSLKAETFDSCAGALELLREQFSKMIPMIPYLPREHEKYQEELDLLRALRAA